MTDTNATTRTTSISSSAECNSDFHKIEVVDTNNYQTVRVNLQQPCAIESDKDLKEYVSELAQFDTASESSLFISVMNWVAAQWQHDGMNEPDSKLTSLDLLKNVHTKGERYRCVEYGKVMADILAAHGHQSRSVGLQAKDVAYGGFGKGHVVTEVWSNEQNKWLFFDPQFSVYAIRENEILNVFDMFSLKNQQKESEITFVLDPDLAQLKGIKVNEVTAGYWGFIRNYLGFHVTNSTGRESYEQLYLLMEADAPALTFQGMGGTIKRVFTQEPELSYPKLNQTTISLMPLPSKKGNFQSICEKFDITTDEQYVSNMWRFAAEGEIAMELDCNMANLWKYQVKENDSSWVDLPSNEHFWKLTVGQNRVSARAISTQGILGPETFIEVAYR
ncbi:hypothetical protein [Vibrio agarivorans]|uniref:hypothetical protein n=1 Tax=Vibrio agarivorans TaxID=153622 RepID=UPI00222EAD05|nr:hypothetical protein [Vibrio agarivorans]MDN3663358.1 hypothetical protein [Vibrio agarivorans]